MAERRVMASHPDYQELNRLNDLLVIARNPAMWFDAQKSIEAGEFPTTEQEVLKFILERHLESQLEGGLFRDYLNTLPGENQGEEI